jgi:hypothetical protein
MTIATVMRAAAIIMRIRRADLPRISIRLRCAGVTLKGI